MKELILQDIKMRNENEINLLKLMAEYPELPIVPMVDADIVVDDSGCYLGKLGFARVDEYVVDAIQQICFKSDYDIWDTLERVLPYKEIEKLPKHINAKVKECYNNLPWKKAIILYIDYQEE